MSATRQRLNRPDGSDSKQKDEKPWWELVHFETVPRWMQDNPQIHSGYRQASYSYVRSFASVLRLHNETVNIFSHGIPALLSLPTAVYLYSVLKPRYEKASTGDTITMGVFFASATLALGMSATYHTLSNHSPSVAKMWNQLDYAGIACLIAGSFVPCVYYGFWCNQTKQIVYWAMISVLGIGCITASVLPRFRTPAWRPIRAGMFVGMGLSAVFPVLDGLREFGFEQMRKQMGFLWVVLQGALYILGAGLYAVSP